MHETVYRDIRREWAIGMGTRLQNCRKPDVAAGGEGGLGRDQVCTVFAHSERECASHICCTEVVCLCG
jgi:hypothetical protein